MSSAKRSPPASRRYGPAPPRPTSPAPRTMAFANTASAEAPPNKWTRVRGHGLGLFCDSKPHLLEDVDTPLAPGMALIVHPNTYHPKVGYVVLGDAVVVTETGVEVLCKTPRELFEVAA